MFYHLYEWLKSQQWLSGMRIFSDITFRAGAAIVLSLVISAIVGKRIINGLRKKQIGETIRDLGLQGEQTKKGTPTMGGVIIILAILIPTLLFANLTNIYVIVLLITTVWCGAIGFIDDYIKVFKKNKAGLAGKFKIVGQVGLGILVGSILYFNSNVTVYREYVGKTPVVTNPTERLVKDTSIKVIKDLNGKEHRFVKVNAPVTTIPFVKGHEFNYSKLLPEGMRHLTWLLYILIVTFIITAVSNGANITDGLDGLATGVSAIIGAALGIFAYVSGNFRFAEYLNVLYMPNLGELSIFIGAFVGACIGFLWYNSYPAQVFMGDTGSLAIGGIIGSLAIIVRKELLIPIFCGVFLVELLSVIIQRYYFKYTKKKYGEGRRVFLMAPLHHHYQKKGYHESKIAVRFWVVTVLLVIVCIVTLKIR
jgi:phospho-N-acetylmuramoyl-pentapeptide-transferase